MHLERGPAICQKQFFRMCTSSPTKEVLINEWNEIYLYWVWCLLLKCTSVLLVDIELFKDRSISLNLMSRTYYQWYFYLLILFAYVPSDILFLVIYIRKPEWWVVIIALLYGDNYSFYDECMNDLLWDMFIIIVSANFLYGIIIFNVFFSHSDWMTFITNYYWKLFQIA